MVKVKLNSKGKWETLEPYAKEGMYIDNFLKANLDYVSGNVRRKDFDSFIVIGGREGYGKSTFAGQIATYLDPTFTLDRCTFTSQQFIEACTSAQKFQAVVFDETMGYLSSRGAMSKFNKDLIKIMSEMRSKNLFVILCIPNFFELDKYAAIHRSTAYIHVWKRGIFVSYDYIRKKALYLDGKKFYNFRVKGNFYGRFMSYFVYDKNAYEEKKQRSIREFFNKNPQQDRNTHRLAKLMYNLYEEDNYSLKKMAEICGFSYDYAYFLVSDYKKSFIEPIKIPI